MIGIPTEQQTSRRKRLTDLSEEERLAAEIRADLAAANEHADGYIASLLRAGDNLLKAKKIVGHGRWQDWLRDNFQLTERTARRYMRIAKVVPTMSEAERTRVAVLTQRGLLRELEKLADRHVVASTEIGPVDLPAGRFETLVIDFPWPSRDGSPAKVNLAKYATPYKCMSDEIEQWGCTTLQDLLADDAHVFFWARITACQSYFRCLPTGRLNTGVRRSHGTRIMGENSSRALTASSVSIQGSPLNFAR